MPKNEQKKPTKILSGRVRSGLARAQALPAERRLEISRKANAVRWGKPPRATHTGNFKEELGIDVECYVLDDVEKTAVISQTGMARVLGLASRGSAFPKFIASRAMSEAVG